MSGLWLSRKLKLDVKDTEVTQNPLCAWPKWQGEMEGRFGRWVRWLPAHTLEAKDVFFFFPSSKCWKTTWLITWELPGRFWRVLEYRVIWTLIFVLRYKRAHRKCSASKHAAAPWVLYPIPRRTSKTSLAPVTPWSYQAWRIRFSLLLLPAFPKLDLESCSQSDPEKTPESNMFSLKDPCSLMRAWQFYANQTLIPAMDRSGSFISLHPYWLRFCWTLLLVVCGMTTIF